MRVSPLISAYIWALFTTGVLSDGPIDAGVLPAEHRAGESRSAEPFLDKIAALFGGGSSNNAAPPPPPTNINRDGPPAANRRPVFNRPPNQPQTSASETRPFSVLPPPRPAGLPKRNSGPGFLTGSGSNISPVSQPAYGLSSAPSDPWQISQPSNMAQIKDLQVQCEKDLMRVRIIFDRPFYGMVFSKGHYSNINCVHVPSGLGQTQATFDIALGQCGMQTGGNSDSYGTPTPQGSYIENTIIVQYDPLLQEVWDQARKIRCTWYDFYEKAVTFKPYNVDMLDPVTANFLGDNLRCWMQVQVGKGPYASEVSGIVKIGQTMTMVLGVKDDENKFDMMVRNCVAHDGSRAPIQLVDEKGCVVREKIMSQFKKIKNFDATANVLSYAYFQAFKFPDSMNVHFQCVVQVCRNSCPEPRCGGAGPASPSIDSYGGPQAPAIDSYGSPQAPSIDSYGSPQAPAIDSYGSPQAPAIDSYGGPSSAPLGSYNGPSSAPLGSYNGPNRRVDPRTPTNSLIASGSENRVTVLNGSPVPRPIPLNKNSNFAKRVGLPEEEEGNALGEGNPRSLDFGEGEEVGKRQARKSEAEEEVAEVRKVDSFNNDLEAESAEPVASEATPEVKPVENKVNERRRRSSATDANGNRILRIKKREAIQVDSETIEEEEATTVRQGRSNEADSDVEEADIQTERIIRVVAPSDVQFQLTKEEKEEVVINTNSVPAESLCIDTAAFVGVTISILMLLVVAIITIIFLWLRIKAIDRKNLL